MSENTKIEWCDHTFNPWTGCTKVSPGCDHCYAESWSKRAGDKVGKWGPGAPRVRTTPANWAKPIAWNKQPYWQCPCGWRGTEREMMPWDDGFGAWSSCPECHSGAFSPTRARVFCASLADVFDNQVPPEWRFDLFKLIAATPDLDWLLLTKRIGNAKAMMDEVARAQPIPGRRTDAQPLSWQPMDNIWIGATITSQAEADRDIPKLLDVPARVRFLSMEPLLGPVVLTDLDWPDSSIVPKSYWQPDFDTEDSPAAPAFNSLTGESWQRFGEWSGRLPQLDWVIVGGESGPGARPMHPDWARFLRDQCQAADVPFLFKQWGNWREPIDGECFDTSMGRAQKVPAFIVSQAGTVHCFENPQTINGGTPMLEVGKKAAGRLLDGVEHNGFPGGAQ